MNESKREDRAVPSEEETKVEQAQTPPEQDGDDATSAYISHARQVIMQPDEYFHDDKGASLKLGLINFAVFLGLTFLYIFFVQVTRFSSWSLKFGHVTSGIRSVLAIGVPLAVAIYALRWINGNQGGAKRSTSFFVEKVGSILIVPSLLLAAALVLRVLNLDLHSWFRGVEMVMVYVGIFLLSYLHASKNRIATAAVFTIAFYFAYRLMLLLL